MNGLDNGSLNRPIVHESFATLHHHLPQLVSHLAAAGRHALTYCEVASRAMLGSLYRLESPRNAFRVAPRQARFSRQREATDKGTTAHAAGSAADSLAYLQECGNLIRVGAAAGVPRSLPAIRLGEPGGVIFAPELARVARREPTWSQSIPFCRTAKRSRDYGPLGSRSGAKLTGELLRRNELNMRLHQVADALITRRLAERSIAIRLRDAYGTVEEEYDLPAECEFGERNLPVASNGD